MTAKLTNYGGIILELYAKDREGKFDKVVLGLDTLSGYLTEEYVNRNPHFGALIGRAYSRKSGEKNESCFGFCLETEHFHDSLNKTNFASTVFRSVEIFHAITIYKFSVNQNQ